MSDIRTVKMQVFAGRIPTKINRAGIIISDKEMWLMQQFKCFLLCSDAIVSWIRMLTGMNASAGEFPQYRSLFTYAISPMFSNHLCLKVHLPEMLCKPFCHRSISFIFRQNGVTAACNTGIWRRNDIVNNINVN